MCQSSVWPLVVQTRFRLPIELGFGRLGAGLGIGDQPQAVDVVVLGQHRGEFGAICR